MIKKPTRVILISGLGLIIGIFNIFVYSNHNSPIFLTIGVTCFILSIGLFKLNNWARMLTIIMASVFIIIYGALLIYTFAYYEQHHGFAGIALIFHLPLLLLSIWSLDCLNNPGIKTLFH
ncbi:MAG: hypothetical protein PHE18_00325 [Candidatus Omnitrophica bacterium]|nr:hypothetical protein [Candidatus Omnitrophota bacterium]MDD5552309.1 hypothetical protein [Candidatus Omnitrophota bacterium]